MRNFEEVNGMSFEPEKIYLHDPHGYFENDYVGDNTVTWSEEQIDDNDYEYIKSPQNLAQPDAYSLLAAVRAILSVGICEKDYKYLDKALDLINKSEHFS
jgi:hypothetical protein